MENCCRTCLKEIQPNQMKFLSTKWNNSSLSLADMLIDLDAINKETILCNETSLKICLSCELDLITSYNFKMVCLSTEKILSEQLTTIDSLEEIKCEAIIDEEISTNEIDSNVVCNEKLNKNSVIKQKSKSSSSMRKIIDRGKKNVEQGKTKNKQIKITIISDNSKSVIDKKTETRRNRKPCLYCKKCDIRFEAEKFYRKHCEDTHWQSYTCNICGKLFLQNRIKKHILTHTTERNHICSVCGAKFTTDTNLKDHLRIHSGEKRYKCHFCDEKFVHSNSRKNHMYKVHTKEKK